MQGFITCDLYPTIGSQCALVERKLMQIQHNKENQIRRDSDMERNPILDVRGKSEYLEKTCKVRYGSATKLAYEQQGNNGVQTQFAEVRGDHNTSLTSQFLLPTYLHYLERQLHGCYLFS